MREIDIFSRKDNRHEYQGETSGVLIRGKSLP